MLTRLPSRYRILQLSDVHFGSRFYGFNRNSKPDPQSWADALAGQIGEALTTQGGRASERAERRVRQFDLLVLSGDLTSYSEENGFDAAKMFMRTVEKSWWAPRKTLVIPGNHDIAFGDPPPNTGSYDIPIIPQPKEQREEPYRKTYAAISRAELATEWLGVLCADRDWKIGVFGLDSCRIEGWNSPGYGFVGFDQIQSFAEKLWNQYEVHDPEPWRRLAFTHHHLLLMDPINPRTARALQWERRPSLDLDAGEVLDALKEYCVDAVFHGHMHRTKLWLDANPRIISAGSASVVHEDCYDENQFFIHEIVEGDNPRLLIQDFRRTHDGSEWGPWTRLEYEPLPLLARKRWRDPLERMTDGDRERFEALQRKHTVKANTAGASWMAWDSWPLAVARLPKSGMRVSGLASVELYDRLARPWSSLRNDHPGLLALEYVMMRVDPYLDKYRHELREEFGRRLDDVTQAISFEQFILEKILTDPWFEGFLYDET